MQNTGFHAPQSALSEAGTGKRAWQDVANILRFRNGPAGCFFAPSTTETSHWLKVTNFGFAVPENRDIAGIQLRFRRRVFPANAKLAATLQQVALVVSGEIRQDRSALLGDRKIWQCSEGTDWETITNGAADDYPGKSYQPLLPAVVNAPDFGVAIQCKGSNTDSRWLGATIDFIEVKIYYTSSPNDRSPVSGSTAVTSAIFIF